MIRKRININLGGLGKESISIFCFHEKAIVIAKLRCNRFHLQEIDAIR